VANMTSSDVARDLIAGSIFQSPLRGAIPVALAVLKLALPLKIFGAENVPREGPLLVVSNHLSNADPPILVIAFPRPLFFLGKSELFRVPILGWLVRMFGGFPVERGTADRAALRTALAVMRKGQAMGIFPEGGRSRTGALVRGYPGVGLLALQSRAPVLPVGIIGTEYFPVNGEWPQKRPKSRPRGVAILFGAPFCVPSTVDGRRVTSEEATRLIMTRIAELLPEEYRGEYRLLDGAAPILAGDGRARTPLLARPVRPK
jgi:1-acyl-sn-glycerol-3-phosphate acyltransferase